MATSSSTVQLGPSAWLTWPEATSTGSMRGAPCSPWAPSFSARAASFQLCTGLSHSQVLIFLFLLSMEVEPHNKMQRKPWASVCWADCWLLLCVCFGQGGDREETREIQGGVSQWYQASLPPQPTAVLCSVWKQTHGMHKGDRALIMFDWGFVKHIRCKSCCKGIYLIKTWNYLKAFKKFSSEIDNISNPQSSFM